MVVLCHPMSLISLNDTFNNRKISSHRTIEAAVKAKAKHIRAIQKANGPGSYVWYSITYENGERVDPYEMEEAEHALGCW